MCTWRFLGPINRRFYASFAVKQRAFAIARREAAKRSFGAGSTVSGLAKLSTSDPRNQSRRKAIQKQRSVTLMRGRVTSVNERGELLAPGEVLEHDVGPGVESAR